MAGTTARYSWPYQEPTDAPDGAAMGQDLAEAVEATVGDVDDRLGDLEDGTARHVGRAYAGATQSLADATWTAIALNQEDFDTGGFHSTSTNNSRVTPSVPGYYRVSATGVFESQSSGVGLDVSIRKNGSDFQGSGVRIIGSTTIVAQQYTALVACNGSSDYFELMQRQDSAGSDNTQISTPFQPCLEWEFSRPL